MPIQLASFLTPKNGNTWYLVEDIYLKGGLQVVADAAARDALNPVNLKAKMLVITQNDGALWQLGADLATWTQLSVQGPQGIQGIQGLPGVQGPEGQVGPAGPQGATGPQGPAGIPGAASTVPGPQGPQGPQGPAGSSGSAGTFPTESDLPSAAANEGTIAIVSATGSAYFAHSGSWIKIANYTVLVIPYDLAFFVAGSMVNALEVVGSILAARNISLPASLVGSIAKAKVAPISNLSFALNLNGAAIGSVDFVAGQTSGTFTLSANTTIHAGDVLDIVTPSVIDSAIKNVSITIVGQAQAPQGVML